jgi:endonuclease YncB( thermonuclease family)
MARASRILTILLGVGVTMFLLGPVAIPLGFDGVWWARQQGQSPPTPPPRPQQPASPSVASPAPAPAPQAAAPAPAPQPAPQHAVEPLPSPPKQAQAEPVGAVPDQTAALAAKDKPAAGEPKLVTKLYYRVTVRDGGTLQSSGVVIKLGGIAARGEDATCKRAGGKTWPCGAEAKAALARLIRSRAVSCEMQQDAKNVVARCAVAGSDLSTWLVRQGWAEPKDAHEPALAEAAQAAKKDKLGLWQ